MKLKLFLCAVLTALSIGLGGLASASQPDTLTVTTQHASLGEYVWFTASVSETSGFSYLCDASSGKTAGEWANGEPGPLAAQVSAVPATRLYALYQSASATETCAWLVGHPATESSPLVSVTWSGPAAGSQDTNEWPAVTTPTTVPPPVKPCFRHHHNWRE